MSKETHKQNTMCVSISLVITSLFLISCLFEKESDDERGSIIDNEIGATIYMVDGETPAVGAKIKIFNFEDTTRTPEKETNTDENGVYSFKGLAKGTYNVWAEQGSLVAFQDSVIVTDDTVYYENDTLGNARSISGFAGIQPNHDPRTVTVQVLGTHKYSNVGEDGLFSLVGLANGEYHLRLVVTPPPQGYTPTFYPLVINENIPDTLQDTIWMIYTGIPAVTGLTAVYDTLIGTVQLSWNKTFFRNIQEYVIFKDDFDAVNKSGNPYRSTEDTVFTDTIFSENSATHEFSFSDSSDYHYKYRVAVRTNSEELGSTYKYASIVAASPLKLQPSFEISIFHAVKEQEIDTTSINDTLRFCLKVHDNFREVSKVTWNDLNTQTEIRQREFDVPANSVDDTLKYSWSEVGEKAFGIIVEDAGGALWYDTLRGITIVKYAPLLIPENDTFTSGADTIRITVSATDMNPDGALEKYYWDRGADGWDDSTDSPEYDFYSANCGPFPVVWGARNDDGVFSTDTFIIMFNCPPSNPEVLLPESYKDWVDLNWATGKGTLLLTFAAEEQNGAIDTLDYILSIGNKLDSVAQVYSGRDKQYELGKIDTNSTVFWKLIIRDLFGESAVDSGSIIAPPLPPLHTCLKGGTFQDTRDSTQYTCVEIGNQTWMAENLNYSPSGSNSWCNGDDPANCSTYGRLYDWDIAVADTNGNGKDICPTGWHLPSDEEWTVLVNFIGDSTVAGKKLKATTWNGTDDYGFSAFSAGYRDSKGSFYHPGPSAYFWTATDLGGGPYIWYRFLNSSDDEVARNISPKDLGFSIRCLED